MGLLQNGNWVDQWYDTKSTNGQFRRQDSQFRNWVTSDGSAGPSGRGGFKAEADRYHLYVSLACPWASRALIFRALKGLEEIIPVSIVHWYMGKDGWTFETGEGTIDDHINGADYLYEIYLKAKADYSGRVTVPVLWDKKTETIVSNESSEIIRMFNSAFNKIGAKTGDFYPENLRQKIDGINKLIYNNVNNGVYKAGFATTQKAYEEAVLPLFDTLDWLEKTLSKKRFLMGSIITEADWRLFTTLVRFDPVYVGHFKCNLKKVSDYYHLSGYLCDLSMQPGISETVNMDHIKGHYYASHETINPSRVIPVGPEVNYRVSHNRESLGIN